MIEEPVGSAEPEPTADEEGELRSSAVDHFRLLSLSVSVDCDSDVLREALRWHMEPFRVAVSPRSTSISIGVSPLEWEEQLAEGNSLREGEMADEKEPWYVYSRNGVRKQINTLSGILSYAIWDVHAMVPEEARDFLFLHAGAVADSKGVILFPAHMNAGKSTLVTALLKRGFEYVSDELGAIDPVSGRAYPFPKRISLDMDALRFFPDLVDRLSDRTAVSVGDHQRFLAPEDLATRAAKAPMPVRSLVFLSPDREGPANMEPLSRAAAIKRMVTHALNLGVYGERGLVLLSRIAAQATSYELRGGTPHDRARVVAHNL